MVDGTKSMAWGAGSSDAGASSASEDDGAPPPTPRGFAALGLGGAGAGFNTRMYTASTMDGAFAGVRAPHALHPSSVPPLPTPLRADNETLRDRKPWAGPCVTRVRCPPWGSFLHRESSRVGR